MLFVIFVCINVFHQVQGLSRPLVIAHRGTAYLPEQTLSSLSMAHAFGADLIEIDVCLSRDDQLIVTHGKFEFSPKFQALYILNRCLFECNEQCS